MKKFMTFLLLVIFASVVFYFGWVQFAVPAGHAGVIISKTGGIDSTPVIPGKFRWTWEKLLPTNCKILSFSLRPVECSFSKSGELPSAELYARFLEGSPSFSWSISASVSVRAKEYALPVIVTRYGIETEEELRILAAELAERAFSAAVEKAIAYSLELKESAMLSSALADFESLFAQELPEGFAVVFAYVEEASLPDFSLYAAGSSIYAEYIAQYSEAARALAVRIAEEELANDEQMRLFEKWGSFLEKFPSLIEFLAVARDDASSALSLLQSLRGEAPAGAEQP